MLMLDHDSHPICEANPGGSPADAAEPVALPDQVIPGIGRTPTSRRAFIKGVIASGAAVSSASYLFRGGIVSSAHA
jgi:hypothetical protein